ncbi:MAG: DUF86 domain-containing protein [Deltaproteobacteria bacterium]|nr:DUF86 domain-containing protein [Deltaproteobacteria bacterium]
MIRECIDFIKDIIKSIEDVQIFVTGFNFNRFGQDIKTVYAVIRAIEIMGEAVKHIPNTIKKEHSDIPWKQIAGMRDKLIHEYFGIDMMIVWKTATKEIPKLKPLFLQIQDMEITKKNRLKKINILQE